MNGKCSDGATKHVDRVFQFRKTFLHMRAFDAYSD